MKKEIKKDVTSKPVKKEVIIKKKDNPKVKAKEKKIVKKKPTKKVDKPLSHKQIMFCEEYIKTQNAKKSYLAVYTNVKEQSAEVLGSTLLRNIKVKAYIEERLKAIEKNSIADANEILKTFTQILRGEVPDQMGLETSVRDRINAGKELAKRYGLFVEPEKPEGNDIPKTPTIKIKVVDNSDLEKELYKGR